MTTSAHLEVGLPAVALAIGLLLPAALAEAQARPGDDTLPPSLQEVDSALAAQVDSSLRALMDSLGIDIDSQAAALPDSTQGRVSLPDVDADGDGVPAIADFCPDSPPGEVVDERGCTVGGTPPWLYAAGGLVGLILLRLLWMPVAAFRRRRRVRAEKERIAELEQATLAALGPQGGRAAHGPWAAAPRHAYWASPPAPPPSPAQPAPPGPLPTVQPPPGTPATPGTPSPALGVGYPDPDPRPGHGVVEGQSEHAAAAQAESVPADAERTAGDPTLFRSSVSEIAGGVSKWKVDPLVYGEARGGRFGVVGRHPLLSLAIVLGLGLGGAWYVRQDGNGRSALSPAAVQGVQAAPVVVALQPDTTAAARRGPVPAQIRRLAGDGQSGRVGQTLPIPLEIRIEDADGGPVPDVPVFWAATLGGGRVSPSAIQTDSTGTARTLWTLGQEVITQYAVARVAGHEESGVAFEAVALPGIAARLTVLRGGGLSAPPGSLLDQPVVVRVEGADGQPLEGIEVAFLPRGGGSVSEEAATSDTAGEVRTAWTLGMTGDSSRLLVQVAEDPALQLDLTAAIAHPRIPAAAGVAAGGRHTCALSENGVLTCWGGNQNGQLGTGAGARAAAPVRVDPGSRYAFVSAGLSHTCAVEQRGRLYCWGDNANGQLGIGSRDPSVTPREVDSVERFRSVSAGTGHSCAVTRSSEIRCWGGNINGQLGDGTTLDKMEPTPVAVRGPYESVSVGWFHSCGLAQDGRALCWGRNAFGQVGDATTEDRTRPTPVAGPLRFRRISAGGAHTCALGSDGRIYCWGQNNSGQVGDGSTSPRERPVPVAAGGPWAGVAVGGVHSCGLTLEGTAYCWGNNTYGQLGDGTTTGRLEPTPVAGDLRFASIFASGAHTCGSTPDGQSFCWGYNIEGQLGDGTRENRVVPTLVGGA